MEALREAFARLTEASILVIDFMALLIVILAASTSGCALAAGIFRAGFWVGVIVALVIVVVLWRLLGRRRS